MGSLLAVLETDPSGTPRVTLSSSNPRDRAESGALCCVADARIDNAADLAARLDLPSDVTPARLILTLYRASGLDCAEQLDGDFAFVIWDASLRRLIGARDRFGIKPLYLAGDSDGLAAASDPGRLPARFRSEMSDAAASAYLAGTIADDRRTFFARIGRVPPAQLFVKDAAGMTLRRYWQFEPVAPDTTPLAAQAERLRELLGRAITRRSAGAAHPGALLSGGLDSSSIARLLRDSSDAPLPTFSMVHSDPKLSERPHIEAVLGQGGFVPQFLDTTAIGPFHNLPQLLEQMHEPFMAPNLATIAPLFAQARAAGIDVLFDGHGGDEVVSHGMALLPRLAREGRWLALWRALRAADCFGQERTPLFLTYLARHRPRTRWLTRTLLRGLGEGPVQASFVPRNLVDPDYARFTGLDVRLESVRSARASVRSSESERHRAVLGGPEQSYGFEVLDRLNRANGIEGRYPFWDRELIEFCLSLPAESRLANGWTRLVLRRAMAPVLPQTVAWRRDKLDFTRAILRGMIADPDGQVEQALSGATLQGYVNLPLARSLWRALIEQPDRADARIVQAIWRCTVFAVWLDQRRHGAASDPFSNKELAA